MDTPAPEPTEITLEVIYQELMKIKKEVGDLTRGVREVQRITSQLKRN
jgi:hypothetical protein